MEKILTKIVDMGIEAVKPLETRYKRAEEIKKCNDSFEDLARENGTSMTMFKVVRGTGDLNEIRQNIELANNRATQRLEGLNDYNGYKPTNDQKQSFMMLRY